LTSAATGAFLAPHQAGGLQGEPSKNHAPRLIFAAALAAAGLAGAAQAEETSLSAHLTGANE
jgi:hypothetical protein